MNNTSVTTAVDQGGAPPLPHRRPRVREVSSRFMSPAPSPSSSTTDLHSVTAKSPLNRPKHSPAPDRSLRPSPSPSQRRLLLVRSQEHEHHSSSNENIPEIVRSMDYTKTESISTQRKPRVKLFKENDSSNNQISKSSSTVLRTNKSTRSDTPAPSSTCDRIVPSRFMLPHRQNQTDAAKLLRLSGLSFSSAASSDDTVVSQAESQSESTSCPNSPISSQQNRTWPLPDTRSSVTNDDTLSARLLIRNSSANCPTSSKFSTPSFCSRSLNFPPSQNSFKSSSDRSVCKPPTAASISVEKENRNLPPQPSSNKAVVDLRKRKNAQEEVHSLKMLHNHYLLWRYANAKAQVSMEVQRTEAEKQFFSLGTDISRLRDTVKKKRAELVVLKRIQALSTIVEAQMPYLDEWSALEEDYTHSLSGATNALTNSLLRLPVSGNVQVNIKEAAEALDSAVKTTDMIVNHMQSFLPKAEEMDTLISELANVNDVEKALVEECGNLLAKTHTLQVEDCSLRGHLMQLRSS
ncbi:hypothetical protein CTI12_AA514690 [Artemisia annua]|uniref:QWRF family n=1 Tax=Artemisia annua TaxID=35608 RepID=A0A2U1L9C5_ARTAN|nr:hypothetical protein CTI12_AA514690 [Artemisia annua]